MALAHRLRQFTPAALCAVTAALTGCATVWTRGVVQDESGGSVSSASVRILEAPDAAPVVATLTDFNGCFTLGALPPRGARRFELEIRAPGYKAATFPFDLQTPVLLVRLVPDSSEASGEIRPATTSELSAIWEPLCIPQLPPGAQQLSP